MYASPFFSFPPFCSQLIVTWYFLFENMGCDCDLHAVYLFNTISSFRDTRHLRVLYPISSWVKTPTAEISGTALVLNCYTLLYSLLISRKVVKV